MRRVLIGCAAAALALGASCEGDDPISPDGSLLTGTWGGDNVSLLLEDADAHVHIGCTNGDFPAPLSVDGDGRINVAGSYVLRAYPIQVGPSLPAQFAGVVDGKRLTFTIAVNDTVEKKLVVLGPVIVTYGVEPRMGPCPICDRRRMRVVR
ncbi:MAG TPA: hypothetical protein VF128_11360 [Gemmatimonadaceae bacterium]